MRVGYFGPEGTFTHEAVLGALGSDAGAHELIPLRTIYDTVIAVEEGVVDRALVPIENSLEGSVNATLDALAFETERVAIVGEVVRAISQCLIARRELPLPEIEVIVSHAQATAQCGRFIRTELPHARVLAGISTADAVRMVAEHEGPWAALGTETAAAQYGCRVLRAGVEDEPGNETRFAWLGRAGGAAGPEGLADAGADPPPGDSGAHPSPALWKTAIVFWGPGAEAPGWLVRCLSEFSTRDVNLTRIESRPRKRGLGTYMFFADLEGDVNDSRVCAALDAVREHVEVLRVLGSFPAG